MSDTLEGLMKTLGKGENSYVVVRENINSTNADGKRHSHIRRADDLESAVRAEDRGGTDQCCRGDIISVTLVEDADSIAARQSAWLIAKSEEQKRLDAREKGLAKLTDAEKKALGLGRHARDDEDDDEDEED